MKKLIIAIIPLFLAFSCIDLDVKPRTGQTSNFVLIHAQAYKQYLAKLYASFSLTGQDGPAGNRDLSVITDEGFSSYIRVYWKAQELTTDEAVITWTDAGIQDLHLHNWSSENQFVKVLYYRIMYTIALTNDFLEQSVPEIMESNGVPSDDFAEIETFRHEARFLRALAYWHALDLYRNVPILTRIIAEPPVQATPQEVFDFIESELNDIENLLPAPHENQYGRADRGALWMLQAKLYLNAGVYTGQPKYTEVLTAVNKIINTGGYTLNADYRTLFMADNHTSNEIIFALNADGQYTQSWGSTTFLVHAPVGGTMVPADYGIDGGWAGLRATSTFVGKFADITGATDWRANFYTDGQTLDIADILTFANGYPIPKFTNIDS
ncbi:MAG: RagB/SusD family nutrient uptake outer membrane protein, partial [Cyclobacteriaceae bacterium]|nr:RagB/SusD family nutrient uptake outer membrane protein [Cyclobacteriaceae bacterium]